MSQKSIAVRALLFALLFVGVASAQTEPPRELKHAPEGTLHGVAVPHHVAWRQLAMMYQASETQIHDFVHTAHLSSLGSDILTEEMHKFQTGYRNLPPRNSHAFEVALDQLDRSVLAELESRLDPVDLPKFVAYIDGHREHIFVPPTDYGMPDHVAAREKQAKENSMVAMAGMAMVPDGMNPNYTTTYSSVFSGKQSTVDNFSNSANWTAGGNGGTWSISSGSAYPTGAGRYFFSSAYENQSKGAVCSSTQLGNVTTGSQQLGLGIEYRQVNGKLGWQESYYFITWQGANGVNVGEVGGTDFEPMYIQQWTNNTNQSGDWIAICQDGTNVQFIYNMQVIYFLQNSAPTNGYAVALGTTGGAGTLKTMDYDMQGQMTQTVMLSGNSSCVTCSGITHTPTVLVAGTPISGPAVSPSSYIDFQTSWGFTDAQLENWSTPYFFGSGYSGYLVSPAVICSQVGDIYQGEEEPEMQEEEAVALEVNSGEPAYPNGWQVIPWCVTATINDANGNPIQVTQDWAAQDVYNPLYNGQVPQYPYFTGKNDCYRLPWDNAGVWVFVGKQWSCDDPDAKYLAFPINGAQATAMTTPPWGNGFGQFYCTIYDAAQQTGTLPTPTNPMGGRWTGWPKMVPLPLYIGMDSVQIIGVP